MEAIKTVTAIDPVWSRILDEAKEAGIDGLIIVDLPPEEDSELCIPAQEKGALGNFQFKP